MNVASHERLQVGENTAQVNLIFAIYKFFTYKRVQSFLSAANLGAEFVEVSLLKKYDAYICVLTLAAVW